jgi:hypothetical protein
MSLTTIIALLGAGLSTFLAFWKDRPSHHIRYDDFANAGLIEVSVENRSDADIIVRGARVLSRRGVKVIFGDSIRENISSQLGRPGTLLRAGGTCTITFDLTTDIRKCRFYLATISWRRLRGLVAPTVPLLVRLPIAELERFAGRS